MTIDRAMAVAFGTLLALSGVVLIVLATLFVASEAVVSFATCLTTIVGAILAPTAIYLGIEQVFYGE